jgi:carbonic anhydrase
MIMAKGPARAVVTCMDHRIKQDVILKNMGWESAYFMRNAGGVVTEDVVRSLFLLQKAVLGGRYDLELLIIAHSECGMISPGDDTLNAQIENDIWFCDQPSFVLGTFPSPELGVRRSVQRIQTSWRRWVNSRGDLKIYGQLYNVKTHKLTAVETYSVKKGEGWAQVAQNCKVDIKKLRAANPQAKRDDDLLGLDQVLYIPR